MSPQFPWPVTPLGILLNQVYFFASIGSETVFGICAKTSDWTPVISAVSACVEVVDPFKLAELNRGRVFHILCDARLYFALLTATEKQKHSN